VQDVTREVFLDEMALIAAADYEIIDSVGGVHLHDMPQNRFAADFHQGFWFHLRFFT
jgi:hypothetical protein